MNVYRFVVFPSGASPSREEIAAFRCYADLLEQRVAYGRHRADGGLAIACEAEPFERLRGLDPAFNDLLIQWQARGARVVERIAFSKDNELWKKRLPDADRSRKRPTKKSGAKRPPPSPAPPDEFEAKNLNHHAREAEGLGRLSIARQSARGRRYERLAAWLPYLLWLAGGVATLAAGGYVAHLLLNASGESRSETIRRLATDAMEQPIQAPNSQRGTDPSGQGR